VPEVVRLLHVPLTRTRTHDGAVPLLVETVTRNVKVVAVVPVPGDALPLPTEIVVHDLARTGVANPRRDALNKLVSASIPKKLIQIRRRP
jgi:hypothetical protein